MSNSSLVVITIFVVCGVYIHYRGQIRHGFFRQLTDHSSIMAPVNAVMYFFSKVPNTPYVSVDQFDELQLLKDNWQSIRDEAVAAYAQGQIKKSDKLDDAAFNSFFKTGWTRFYLKWYKQGFHPSAQELCPKTVELLSRCPSVKAAMFTVLPSGARLVKHRDPYAGSLRYHLGLVTPNDDGCFIDVDGQLHSWRDGEHVMFDETYIHYADNQTDIDRIILFCDVERPMSNIIATWMNKVFARVVIAAAAAKNDELDRAGLINKIFYPVYQIRIIGKRVKAKSQPVYYGLKYLLFAAILYGLLF